MNVRSATADNGIKFASEDFNKMAWNEICKSNPSDHILIDDKEDDALCSLWQRDVSIAEAPPSDIFFAGTIPLLDCILTVDETNIYKQGKQGRIMSMRFVILKNYKDKIAEAHDENILVGYMIEAINNHSIIWPIGVGRGYGSIFTAEPASHNLSIEQIERFQEVCSEAAYCQQVNEWMATWYGIQIALLHPTVKTIFQHPETERIYNPSHNKKKDKRVTCYVKKHVIKSGDVESAMRGGDHNFTRKTMVWYVIGHWRNYSDGRKVFVHPYWKGPLRELKQNIDEGRERKIAIGGDAV